MTPQLRSSNTPLAVTRLDFSFTCHHCSEVSCIYDRALPASTAIESLRELHKLGLLPSPLYQWHCPRPCRHRSCVDCTFKVRRSVLMGDGEWTITEPVWKEVQPIWMTK